LVLLLVVFVDHASPIVEVIHVLGLKPVDYEKRIYNDQFRSAAEDQQENQGSLR
jgi:hypothetical protein